MAAQAPCEAEVRETGAAIFPFDNTYARLPERFFARLSPIPVPAPQLVQLNRAFAGELGIDADRLGSPSGVAILAGNSVPSGAEPIAMAYAGHQFGQFVPSLGDGRALLLGEIIGRDGQRKDIQLKGSGQTSFSRRGDGRAVLGPVLREYILAEAMATLGIPTTRALAAVTTGETVWRDRPLPGAILTRVASSHIRIGTFQYFAARQDIEAIRILSEYAIARHYPELMGAPNPVLAFFDNVVSRQAELIAKWMLVGFIHGVMNTDNMSISGETIDYGPCAFLDAYDPAKVFSSIDAYGRYAYGNQPAIAQWNLTRFAEALLPAAGDDAEQAAKQAQEIIDAFPARFEAVYARGMRAKLGLFKEEPDDMRLANELLECMARNKADFTLTFRNLCEAADGSSHDDGICAPFADPAQFEKWALKWRQRLERESVAPQRRKTEMRKANPVFIPRNHLVEEAIAAAQNERDFIPFQRLLDVLSNPYEDKPDRARYGLPPRPGQEVHQTFCGT